MALLETIFGVKCSGASWSAVSELVVQNRGSEFGGEYWWKDIFSDRVAEFVMATYCIFVGGEML